MAPQAVPGAFLLIVHGGRSGERIPIGQGENVVGSGECADIRFTQVGVRDRHAILKHTPGGVIIEDTGLASPTWVNGRRLISSHQLTTGDQVRIGSVRMLFDKGNSASLPTSERPLTPAGRGTSPAGTWRVMAFDMMGTLAVIAAVLGVLGLVYVVTQAGGDHTTGDARLPVAKGVYDITAVYNQPGERWARGYHTGLDFAAPSGTVILAVTAGTVVEIDPDHLAYGRLTKIRHADGTEVWYAHQSAINVRLGDSVVAGEVIGAVGASGNVTGSHLHLEIYADRLRVDPRRWLSDHGATP